MTKDFETEDPKQTRQQDDTSAMTVFYDGACPLCSREIAFYKKRKSLSSLTWVDVSNCAKNDIPNGLTRHEVMARFHVRLADGTLRSGPRGFGEIWARMQGFAWLGKALQTNCLQPLLEWLYRGFLVVRTLTIKQMGKR